MHLPGKKKKCCGKRVDLDDTLQKSLKKSLECLVVLVRNRVSSFGHTDRDRGAGGTGGASAPPITLGEKIQLKNYCFTAFMDMR